MTEADAFSMVALWHRKQGDLYRYISRDESRMDRPAREKALQASTFHYGCSAALYNKASDLRRKEVI